MKVLTLISSGNFEFMSGKCQGILFCPQCGNPELDNENLFKIKLNYEKKKKIYVILITSGYRS